MKRLPEQKRRYNSTENRKILTRSIIDPTFTPQPTASGIAFSQADTRIYTEISEISEGTEVLFHPKTSVTSVTSVTSATSVILKLVAA